MSFRGSYKRLSRGEREFFMVAAGWIVALAAFTLLLFALAGCRNGASDYAYAIDPKAVCEVIRNDTNIHDDVALCNVQNMQCLCAYAGRWMCQPLGAPLLVEITK